MKHILWTGGWDSTFRVLQLSIIYKEEIQPYYVIDEERKSNVIELKTMENIKKKLEHDFPYTKGLIKDTIFINKAKIPENSIISTKYKNLTKMSFMGSQYDWLARYSEAHGLNELELNIHKDDKAEFFVRPYVNKIEGEIGSNYSLNDNMIGTDFDIFKYYNFPLLDFTKEQMGEFANKNKFGHLMEMTWFCFNPTWRNTSCGYCNPCKYTREEGLGRRVPSKKLSFYNKLENRIYYKIIRK